MYVSKEKFDQRCKAQRMPTQTLSRHLEEFLLHKYGLRSMAGGQAAAVRTAVEKFGGEDTAIRVFGMALRNEVRMNVNRANRERGRREVRVRGGTGVHAGFRYWVGLAAEGSTICTGFLQSTMIDPRIPIY